MYSDDIDDEFGPLLKTICARNGWDWKHLLQVMMSESACKANAHNDFPRTKIVDGKSVKVPPEERYNAVGLIQFMPFVLKSLGYVPNAEQEARNLPNYEAFKELSATEQLPWVESFYRQFKGYGLNSPARLYQATFLPVTLKLGSSSDTVLVAKNGFLGWAYTPNAAFDVNKDLTITVGELEAAILRAAKGGRYNELVRRISGVSVPDQDDSPSKDLGTRTGIQAALKQLGYYDGEIDGLWGPKSDAATRKFQKDLGLTVDGIVGPNTKAALGRKLEIA